MSPKSPFLTFILSWVPGLGHLYLGLNRRGLQFMIGFFVCVALIQLLPSVFPFAVAIIWFYALFDALQKVAVVNAYIARGGTTFDTGTVAGEEQGGADATLSSLDQTVNPMKALQEKNTIDPVWIGAVCVILGLLVLIRQVFPYVWTFLLNIHIGSILLAAVLIGFGIWLIRLQRKREQE